MRRFFAVDRGKSGISEGRFLSQMTSGPYSLEDLGSCGRVLREQVPAELKKVAFHRGLVSTVQMVLLSLVLASEAQRLIPQSPISEDFPHRTKMRFHLCPSLRILMFLC